MIRDRLVATAAVLCVAGVSFIYATLPTDSPPIEGLWSGSWGGGPAPGGVFFQPVLAEMFVERDRVELVGFRNADRLTGTVRIDSSAKRLRLTPVDDSGGRSPKKPLEYRYEFKGDTLVLSDSDNVSTILQRRHVTQNPVANVQAELVAADGINDAGDLLITEFTQLRAGRAGATYFEITKRALKTARSIVIAIEDNGWKLISVKDARKRLRKAGPVVLTYRHDDGAPPNQSHELWQELGPPAPDSEIVWRTLARTLRPGSLVFVLSAKENAPVP